jgi:hypothetical protein
VKAVLKELAQVSSLDKKEILEKEKANALRMERFLNQLKEIQKRYWKNL